MVKNTIPFNHREVLGKVAPFLLTFFVLTVNELSLALNEALISANIQGVSLGPGCPPIHSLMFADDLLLVGQAKEQEVRCIHSILNTFFTYS